MGLDEGRLGEGFRQVEEVTVQYRGVRLARAGADVIGRVDQRDVELVLRQLARDRGSDDSGPDHDHIECRFA